MKKFFSFIGLMTLAVLCLADLALAEAGAGSLEETVVGITEGVVKGLSSLSAALVMGVAVISGTYAQAKAASTALDAIGRNPSASGKLFMPMILGLVFLETLVIFTFVIALFLIG